jgi:hypothetical protein
MHSPPPSPALLPRAPISRRPCTAAHYTARDTHAQRSRAGRVSFRGCHGRLRREGRRRQPLRRAGRRQRLLRRRAAQRLQEARHGACLRALLSSSAKFLCFLAHLVLVGRNGTRTSAPAPAAPAAWRPQRPGSRRSREPTQVTNYTSTSSVPLASGRLICTYVEILTVEINAVMLSRTCSACIFAYLRT